jgi:calcineurin-like phosphoesterase family protein
MPRLEKKIWLSADQHFEHVNILKYCDRPFENVTEMARVIMQPYKNGGIHPFDAVYWLGDLCFGKCTPTYVKAPCRIEMIRGNHDKMRDEDYEKMGVHVQDSIEIEYGGEKILLVHDPMRVLRDEAEKRGTSLKGRNLTWDEPYILQLAEELPQKVFCGHVHRLFKRFGQFINVGVDVWDYRPITIEEALGAYAQPSMLNDRQHHRLID